MPWNIILIVGLIGFAMGLNSGFADYRKRIMDGKYEEREQARREREKVDLEEN